METYSQGEGIKVFQYGQPLDTDSVTGRKVRADFAEPVKPVFARGGASICLPLEADDYVYGLGANLGGINKRGRRYQSYCTDEPSHTEDKTALYGAHNFFIIAGAKSCGYFLDFPGRVTYDVGFSVSDELSIEISGQDFSLYFIEGNCPEEISSKFLSLIGRAYIPPKWGFGYFQSRWGYRDKNEVLKVREAFREQGIPLEGIYLDLDYMDNFKDFTISPERFSGFKEFAAKLKAEGIYLIPIIDAGVKVEAGYEIYDEGIAGGHFCLDKEGKPYVAAVWPGKVHFPDFFRPETRAWFGSKYKVLTACGIEGAWNDMNEPAIFYDEKFLQEAVDTAIASRDENLDAFSFFALKDKFCRLANKVDYYQSFFHQVGDKVISNDEVHNLYGQYMTKAASTGLAKLLGKRFLLISRASSIGMHRYSGIWTGDNCSWWSHLEQNIKNMPSLNMCGFFYTGADTGGFGSDSYGELLVRWLQFSVFTPLLRNHSAVGCINQEPYAFGEKVTAMAKALIEARYMLVPYLYSEYMQAVKNYRLMFKPLTFEFSEELARQSEDQLFLGDQLMLAPVSKPNQRGRFVYLPEKMAEVSFGPDGVSLAVKDPGIHYLQYPLDQFKFYLRKNAMLPYIPPCLNTKALNLETLKVLAYVEERAEYSLYDDDGISHDFAKGKSWTTYICIEGRGDDYSIEVENNNPAVKRLELTIVDSANRIRQKILEL